jgi:hypothetical protein
MCGLYLVLKNSVLWDIMPCNPMKVSCCFGSSIFKAETEPNKKRALSRRSRPDFLLGLFFYPEDGSDMFIRNVG